MTNITIYAIYKGVEVEIELEGYAQNNEQIIDQTQKMIELLLKSGFESQLDIEEPEEK